ncbi:MAG: RNA polymerase sigma factor [Bacteroidota bacterium]
MLSEEEIIKGCLKGDKIAQKALYDKYSAKMFGVCLRYLKNIDEAEDALQDGFIRIYGNIDTYNFKGSFDGWIRRIIVNATINYHNYNLKHRFHVDYSEIENSEIETNLTNDVYSAEALLSLIRSLPEGYKQIFNLYEIDGYSHKEIAKMLGISINTSKSQLMKAKNMLKARMNTNKNVI